MTRTDADSVPQMHEGVAQALTAAGIEPAAVAALLDFDLAHFQWVRRVAKQEMIAAILSHLGLDIEPAHFQGLVSIQRIRCGVGRDTGLAPTIGLVAEEMAERRGGGDTVAPAEDGGDENGA